MAGEQELGLELDGFEHGVEFFGLKIELVGGFPAGGLRLAEHMVVEIGYLRQADTVEDVVGDERADQADQGQEPEEHAAMVRPDELRKAFRKADPAHGDLVRMQELADIVGELGDGVVAVLRIGRSGFQDDRLHVRVDHAAETVLDRRPDAVAEFLQDLGRGGVRERRMERDEFVEDHPCGVDVGPDGRFRAGNELGRDEAGIEDFGPPPFRLGVIVSGRDEMRKPPALDIDLVVFADQDVLRMQVRMNDLAAVGVDQPVRDAEEKLKTETQRGGLLRSAESRAAVMRREPVQEFAEVRAVGQLHGGVQPAAVVAVDAVDGQDGRMVELGRDLRLGDEAGALVRIQQLLVAQRIHRHFAFEAEVLSDGDHVPPAFGELALDFDPVLQVGQVRLRFPAMPDFGALAVAVHPVDLRADVAFARAGQGGKDRGRLVQDALDARTGAAEDGLRVRLGRDLRDAVLRAQDDGAVGQIVLHDHGAVGRIRVHDHGPFGIGCGRDGRGLRGRGAGLRSVRFVCVVSEFVVRHVSVSGMGRSGRYFVNPTACARITVILSSSLNTLRTPFSSYMPRETVPSPFEAA